MCRRHVYCYKYCVRFTAWAQRMGVKIQPFEINALDFDVCFAGRKPVFSVRNKYASIIFPRLYQLNFDIISLHYSNNFEVWN